MSGEILKDPRVRASLDRLRGMGLKTYTIAVDNDTVAVVLDIESVVNYIRRTLEARITYPNKHFIYDKQSLLFGVVLSRNSKKLAKLNDSEVIKALELYSSIVKGDQGDKQ